MHNTTPTTPEIRIDMVSEQACRLTFAATISNETADQITVVSQQLRKIAGIIDLIPSYTTLLVIFDTDHYDRFAICRQVTALVQSLDFDNAADLDAREVVIPVYYGSEVGPDLEYLAEYCHLTVKEVIAQHSKTAYRAYAIGFTPGFAFLGNTPEALHCPRKDTPRLKVPTGSVAVAEQQTAVYPSSTPGGWQIIGRTPLQLVDWGSESLALIEAGDTVRFEPISRDEFLAQGGTLDGF